MNSKTQKKLNYISETKDLIRDAIVSKGVEVSANATFRSYVDKIAEIGSSGGGSLPAGIYMTPYITGTNINYPNRIFTLNGEIYTAGTIYYNNGDIQFISKWNGSSWTTVAGSTASGASSIISLNYACDSIEFNGKRHFYTYGKHYGFDGSSVTKYADTDSTVNFASYYAVFENELYLSIAGKLYKWNEADDTWTTLLTYDSSSYPKSYQIFATNKHLYVVRSALYIYENGALNEVAATPTNFSAVYKVVDNDVYYIYSNRTIYKYNLDTLEGKELGSIQGLYQGVKWIGNDDELAIMGNCHKLTSNCTAYYPAFKLHIIE